MGNAIKDNIITTVLIVIFIILACIGVTNHIRISKVSNQATVAKNEAQIEQKAYNEKYLKVHKLFFHNDMNSKDPKVKSMAINHLAISNVYSPMLKFFEVFYNYNSHQQYVDRPKALRSIATSNVLDNKKYFNDDKDVSGDSIIESEQLNSEFETAHPYVISHNKDNINVIADTHYKSWTSDTDDQKHGEEGYELNYNTVQHKFTSIKELYHIDNVSNLNS